MLINLTNHPLSTWSKSQIEAAKTFGDIKDHPFPDVSPDASEEEIEEQASAIVNEILSQYEGKELAIHLMGEFCMTYSLLAKFQNKGIPCVASTTKRIASIAEDGKKIVDFQFVRFRKYISL